MKHLLSILPERAKKILRPIRNYMYYGNNRYCPVCGQSSRRFKQFGIIPRDDAQCVHCGSLERHRFTWLFLQKKTDLLNGRNAKKMLHIAPEACFESRLKELMGDNYLTADLFNSAMVKMDICDIHYPDQSFDVIYCSHVLEHVNDDLKAMRELCRVLNKNGWAILNVPIISDKTFEDPSIVTPKDRLEHYGQEDHVRRYGPDYIERLRNSGFSVAVTKVGDLFDEDEATRMGLTKATGEIYYCTKD